MSVFAPAPEPASKLGYYRLLSPSCSLRVSPICLGAMNFGTTWAGFMGDMTKENAFAMMDYYYTQGGNFIDTANNYQEGESESWMGEWLEKRGIRDEIVIATKYTSPLRNASSNAKGVNVNYCGNGKKSLVVSVESSLKRLKTSYIDLLYVHWWDYTTSVEEMMQGLNQLVVAGKVLYLGVSDTPAWIVSKANQYARDHGLAPFVVYQGKWSLACRDMERDIIPMVKAEGMGIAPWGVLGQGMFKTDEEIAKLKETGEKTRAERPGRGYDQTREVTKKMEKLAKEKNTNVSTIAMAYVFSKTPYVFPILGGRKVDQLKQNVEGLSVKLTDDEIKSLEESSSFHLGFPFDMLGTKQGENMMMASVGKYDWVQGPKPPQ